MQDYIASTKVLCGLYNCKLLDCIFCISFSNRQTPFHLACHQGDAGLVRLLLKWSADVNLCDDDGNTPLCISAGNVHSEVLKELLRSGKK